MLADFLISELFAFLLVFCRIGSTIMALPGFGESYVPVRVRLMLALSISAVLSPGMQGLPPVPTQVFTLFTIIAAEIMIGVFIGLLARMLISAIQVGGMIIAFQSSLASALVPELSQATGGQGSVLGNMLGITAITLIFATNTHHLMLWAAADSYNMFEAGHFPDMADIANKAAQTMNNAFDIALKLAAPHILVGLVFYLGNGIIARLMPNIQIFFIMIPPQLMISFFILMIVSSSILMWYLEYFREGLGFFIMTGP